MEPALFYLQALEKCALIEVEIPRRIPGRLSLADIAGNKSGCMASHHTSKSLKYERDSRMTSNAEGQWPTFFLLKLDKGAYPFSLAYHNYLLSPYADTTEMVRGVLLNGLLLPENTLKPFYTLASLHITAASLLPTWSLWPVVGVEVVYEPDHSHPLYHEAKLMDGEPAIFVEGRPKAELVAFRGQLDLKQHCGWVQVCPWSERTLPGINERNDELIHAARCLNRLSRRM